MAFDVSKFLALTALIAGTGAACSTTDGTDEPGGGAGTSGSAGQSSAGTSANQGGAVDAGNGGAAAGGAGEGGGPALGGAGAGGASLGGAAGAGGAGGGAGGTPDLGECLGALAAGGAGGAGSVEIDPSLEGLCSDFYQTDCGNEELSPSYTVCEGVKQLAQPAVAVAVADCITALSATDECDGAKVAACFSSLEGRGCANPDSATACATITARAGCEAVTLASCQNIADLVNSYRFLDYTKCMDPSIEGFYDPDFAGTCAERLEACAGVFL